LKQSLRPASCRGRERQRESCIDTASAITQCVCLGEQIIQPDQRVSQCLCISDKRLRCSSALVGNSLNLTPEDSPDFYSLQRGHGLYALMNMMITTSIPEGSTKEVVCVFLYAFNSQWNMRLIGLMGCDGGVGRYMILSSAFQSNTINYWRYRANYAFLLRANYQDYQ